MLVTGLFAFAKGEEGAGSRNEVSLKKTVHHGFEFRGVSPDGLQSTEINICRLGAAAEEINKLKHYAFVRLESSGLEKDW